MENRIAVYHRLYVLCMEGMLPGLLLSIFLYIRLDMYEVFGYFRRKWCAGRKCVRKSKRKVSFLLVFVTAFVLWTGLGLMAHGEEEPTEDVSGVRIICQEADIQIGEKVYYRDSFWVQVQIEKEDETIEEMLDSFVLKPLYTSQEIAEFRRKNQEDGRFTVTEETIQSVEDLEKLFFVWQEATEVADTDKEITVGKELESKDGYRFSELTVREK